MCDAHKTMISESARVLGPYPNGQKWRLVVKEGTRRKSMVFDTREQAEGVRGSLLTALEDRGCRAIGDTVDEYLAFKQKRGCTERTLRTVRDKLIPFLPASKTLRSITPEVAERLYAEQTEKVAVATHHKNLRDAKAFFGFCIRQKYLTENPFADVQPIGKANAGKPQLRTDEARKLSDYLIGRATDGDLYALALIVQVLLGLRSGEALKLRKRDLDCGGKVVVIDGTKTKNAKRTLELDAPSVRTLLLRRCEPLAADALIDLGAPLWQRPAGLPPFSAVVLAAGPVPDLELGEPYDPVTFLAATPISANEAAWARLEGVEALREVWRQDGVDVTDPQRVARQPS